MLFTVGGSCGGEYIVVLVQVCRSAYLGYCEFCGEQGPDVCMFCCFCSQNTVRPEGEAGFEILDIFLSKVRRVPSHVVCLQWSRSLITRGYGGWLYGVVGECVD